MSFLFRFPSDRAPEPFSDLERKGIWRVVRRGYRRDRFRARALHLLLVLIVIIFCIVALFSGMK